MSEEGVFGGGFLGFESGETFAREEVNKFTNINAGASEEGASADNKRSRVVFSSLVRQFTVKPEERF
jgi:hypothetical protein